jgi:hypothetical protein
MVWLYHPFVILRGEQEMRSDWILDVVNDLKTFARANEMPLLAEQLDDTAIVALAEIAAYHENRHAISFGQEQGLGGSESGAGAGEYA